MRRKNWCLISKKYCIDFLSFLVKVLNKKTWIFCPCQIPSFKGGLNFVLAWFAMIIKAINKLNFSYWSRQASITC